MCASKCNNLLQYILGEADDTAGRISEPPGWSRGTRGHLNRFEVIKLEQGDRAFLSLFQSLDIGHLGRGVALDKAALFS